MRLQMYTYQDVTMNFNDKMYHHLNTLFYKWDLIEIYGYLMKKAGETGDTHWIDLAESMVSNYDLSKVRGAK